MASRLLIIDGDPLILKVLRAGLRDYSVVTASSGEEGVGLYAAQPFDAVICDLVLPGMQGLEVIRRIRERAPEARVLIITGHDTQARLLAALRENIVDFLAKPFAMEDLRAAVANLLACEEAIKVISATPQWIELHVPASFQVVARLGKFFEQLHAEIDAETRNEINIAFHELLNNAIEHGCEGEARRRITVCYLRLSQLILYRINDPGRGFRLEELFDAAITNPDDEPCQHLEVREASGKRPGGFGMLLTRGIVDELIYNQQGNEVVFARYLNRPPKD